VVEGKLAALWGALLSTHHGEKSRADQDLSLEGIREASPTCGCVSESQRGHVAAVAAKSLSTSAARVWVMRASIDLTSPFSAAVEHWSTDVGRGGELNNMIQLLTFKVHSY
jgi:hypothetical protein